MQWNAVGSPDDGHKDARNMLRYYWLPINPYLLHLVGPTLTYLSKMHGHSNIKFTNKQFITTDLYRFSVVRAGSYEFHTISNCVDIAVWVSPMAYPFRQDNPESTELCAWWGMHASSPHSGHFIGVAAGRLDTKLKPKFQSCHRGLPAAALCSGWRSVTKLWAPTWGGGVWSL